MVLVTVIRDSPYSMLGSSKKRDAFVQFKYTKDLDLLPISDVVD